jgi:hypothetical protein
VRVPRTATEDTAKDIATPDVIWYSAITQRKCQGAGVVRNHTIRSIDPIYIAVTKLACVRSRTCNLLDTSEEWSEDVCVIIRSYTLNGSNEALKAHASVNVFSGKGLQRAIILAIELDEDIIPDFHNEWVIFIDKMGGITAAYVVIVNLTE